MGALLHGDVTRAPVELTAGRQVRIDFEMSFTGGGRAQGMQFGGHAAVPTDLAERAVHAAREADTAIVFAGVSQDSSLESQDRDSLALPAAQTKLIEQVCAANPRTVVVVNAPFAADMPWADRAAAVLLTWFPGQEYGPALADVLTGALVPGGRLPVTLARADTDHAVTATAPSDDGRLTYTEGVLTGYRHFDALHTTPRFCFGHGLGYGDIRWRAAHLHTDPTSRHLALAGVTLNNAAGRVGKEVIQVYAAPLTDTNTAEPGRPEQHLVGFAAVHVPPGRRSCGSTSPERAGLQHVGHPGRQLAAAGRPVGDPPGPLQPGHLPALPCLHRPGRQFAHGPDRLKPAAPDARASGAEISGPRRPVEAQERQRHRTEVLDERGQATVAARRLRSLRRNVQSHGTSERRVHSDEAGPDRPLRIRVADLVPARQKQGCEAVPQIEVAHLPDPGHRLVHRAQLHKGAQYLPAPFQQTGEPLDQFGQQIRERLPLPPVSAQQLLLLGGKLLLEPLLRRAEDIVLAVDPGVDGPHRNLGTSAHLSERETLVALLGEQLQGGVQHQLEGSLTALLLRSSNAGRLRGALLGGGHPLSLGNRSPKESGARPRPTYRRRSPPPRSTFVDRP